MILKEASTTPRVNAVAAAIESIAGALPFKRNVSYDDRVKIATRLVTKVFQNNKRLNAKSALTRNALLRIAEKVISSQQRSAVSLVDQTTGLPRTYPEKKYENSYQSDPQTTSTAKDKDNIENSGYQTPDEMRKALKAQGVSDKAIEMAVEAAFGTAGAADEPKVGSLKQKVWDLHRKLVNAGMATSTGLKLARQIYGLDTSNTGKTITETRNWGYGGGKSTSTTKIPPSGYIKKASIDDIDLEVPSYVVHMGDEAVTNFKRMVAANTNIRSASVADEEYLRTISDPDMVYYAASRAPKEREAEREARHTNSIKSAVASTTIPKWMIAANLVDVDGNIR